MCPKDNLTLKQHFTPEGIIQSMVKYIPLQYPTRIIDFAVGKGGLLKYSQKKWPSARLFGIDVDPNMIEICKERFNGSSYFYQANSLDIDEESKLLQIKNMIRNRSFDFAICNPPFGKNFLSSAISSICDILMKSNIYPLYNNIGRLRLEFLFLIRNIESVREGGYISIILPYSIVAGKKGLLARKYILTQTHVKYSLKIPEKVFNNLEANTYILILKKGRERTNKEERCAIGSIDEKGNIKECLQICAERLYERMDFDYFKNVYKFKSLYIARKGRKYEKLGNFIESFRRGRTSYGENRLFSKDVNDFRYLHTTTLSTLGIDYILDQKFICKKSNLFFDKALVDIGSLVISRVGKRCLGKAAIIHNSHDIGLASDCINIIEIKGINPYFVVVLLKTKFSLRYFEMCKRGVCSQFICKEDIYNFPIQNISSAIVIDISEKYRNILDQYADIKLNERYNYFRETKVLRNELEKLVNQIDNLLYPMKQWPTYEKVESFNIREVCKGTY